MGAQKLCSKHVGSSDLRTAVNLERRHLTSCNLYFMIPSKKSAYRAPCCPYYSDEMLSEDASNGRKVPQSRRRLARFAAQSSAQSPDTATKTARTPCPPDAPPCADRGRRIKNGAKTLWGKGSAHAASGDEIRRHIGR